MCLQERLLSECSCNLPTYRKLDDKIPTCADQDCISSNYIDFGQNGFNECLKKCPPECETSNLGLSTSFADYPTPDHAQLIKNYLLSKDLIYDNVTLHEISQNVAAIDIFYEDNIYTNVTEIESTSIQSLISTIGGHLGLFLGMSF